MKQSEQKKYCKDCGYYWNKGIKDGKHNNWCCNFGVPAKDIFNHCVNVKGKVVKEQK